MKSYCSLAIICTLFTPFTVLARKVQNWPYEHLFQEADLVVIGYPQGVGSFAENWNENSFDKNRFEGVETTFGVRSILKGDAPLCIHVMHFKYKHDVQPYDDGPNLVSFFTKPISLHVNQSSGNKGRVKILRARQSMTSEPDYLLFLKRRKDGHYEALSGQMDAALSVRALFAPNALR